MTFCHYKDNETTRQQVDCSSLCFLIYNKSKDFFLNHYTIKDRVSHYYYTFFSYLCRNQKAYHTDE